MTTPSATSFIDRDSNGAHGRNQHACHDQHRFVDSGTVLDIAVRTPEAGYSESKSNWEDKSTVTEGSDWSNPSNW